MPFNKIITTMALLIVATFGVSVLAVQPADAAFKIRLSSRGDLTVTGDNNADHVEIRSADSTTWEVTVSNGATTTTRQYTDAQRNIPVNTRGGEDFVIIEDLTHGVARPR